MEEKKGVVFGLRFSKRRIRVEGCFLLRLELIFSRELQLMSGSSKLLALIGGIWKRELGRGL